VDDAADRLEDAQRRIEVARAQAPSVENLHSWLSALSDYAQALSELHEFTNESIHEKLQVLLAQVKLREPAPGIPRDDTVPGGHLREGP
jgi:phage shock protein A